MAKDTDKELVRRVQKGDRYAFDLLFSRYQHKILNLVSRYLKDPQDVEDVTQEAFIKAFRAFPRFRGESAFYTWLYRIAINTAKNHLVARGRRPPGVDVDMEDAEFMDGADALRESESPEAALERDNPEKAMQIAGQAKDRARTTLADARRAIDDLRLSEATPVEAIEREVERFTAATGIPCALDMPAHFDVSQRNGEHVIRCVGEGLANVAQHAQATQAWVSISPNKGLLQVTVRDDGRGFDVDADAAGGHYGLLGLRERARLAGGQLTVDSRPGEGTTLRMTFPTLREDDAAVSATALAAGAES